MVFALKMGSYSVLKKQEVLINIVIIHRVGSQQFGEGLTETLKREDLEDNLRNHK